MTDQARRSRIIDMSDVLVGEIEIKNLGGNDYTIKDQLPLDLALEIMEMFESMQEAEAEKKFTVSLLRDLYDKLSKVFVYSGYPEMTGELMRSHLTLQQGQKLLRELTDRLLSQQEEAGNP
jgi:hypothetical protein